MMLRQGRHIILEYNVYNDLIESGLTACHCAKKWRLIDTEDSDGYNALTLLIKAKRVDWIRKKLAVYLNLKLAQILHYFFYPLVKFFNHNSCVKLTISHVVSLKLSLIGVYGVSVKKPLESIFQYMYLQSLTFIQQD